MARRNREEASPRSNGCPQTRRLLPTHQDGHHTPQGPNGPRHILRGCDDRRNCSRRRRFRPPTRARKEVTRPVPSTGPPSRSAAGPARLSAVPFVRPSVSPVAQSARPSASPAGPYARPAGPSSRPSASQAGQSVRPSASQAARQLKPLTHPGLRLRPRVRVPTTKSRPPRPARPCVHPSTIGPGLTPPALQHAAPTRWRSPPPAQSVQPTAYSFAKDRANLLAFFSADKLKGDESGQTKRG